jgi:hypothetical protein
MEPATIDAVRGGPSLKILVVMEHPGVGSLVPALQLLHDRGHRLQLAYESAKSVEGLRELEVLAEECPGIVFTQLPSVEASGWGALTARLRRSIDYVRYLEPRYREATQLRARAARKAPPAIRRLGRLAGLAGPRGLAALRRGLQLVEGCLVPPAQVERFLAEQDPDVLIPTHLLPIGTTHADYLRAAKRLGIHTVFPVRGWDNLTNKGLLRDAPGLMLVWNEPQAREAEELHRVPRERLRLTGAMLCDHWFEWSPGRDREAFCREVGLRPDRPIVLYTCSSGFVARGKEAAFVSRWIEGLRQRGGLLAEAGFLIRPHPLNAAQWADAELDGDQVRVWPRFGEAPHDESSRRNFYDSIFHAAAVVGINTTAQIESAIVGRPVHTLLAEEFRATQQGTLHFHYLQAEEFGHLLVGRTFEEHAEQLEESLRGRAEDGRNERFLRRFVRPLGLDRSATGLVVEAIEELGSRPAPAPDRGPWLAPAVRLMLAPRAALLGRGIVRRRKTMGESTPTDELRSVVRARAMHRAGMPVIVGPWLEDEVGELLYWIPFLRWAQTMSPGLRERLFVVSRASSAAWYAGIGAGRADLEQLVGRDLSEPSLAGLSEDQLQGPLREQVEDAFGLGSRAFRVLPASLVVAARSELAERTPAERLQERLLEFAPLPAPEAPAGLAPSQDFVAVRGDAADPGVVSALADRVAVVALDGLDRRAQAAVLARARGFVGRYGVEAVLAVLSGTRAVAFAEGLEEAVLGDLRLASAFLADAPYGRLQVLEAGGSAEEAAERALRLLDASVEALAAV